MILNPGSILEFPGEHYNVEGSTPEIHDWSEPWPGHQVILMGDQIRGPLDLEVK